MIIYIINIIIIMQAMYTCSEIVTGTIVFVTESSFQPNPYKSIMSVCNYRVYYKAMGQREAMKQSATYHIIWQDVICCL